MVIAGVFMAWTLGMEITALIHGYGDKTVLLQYTSASRSLALPIMANLK
jgi:hypothetical protein